MGAQHKGEPWPYGMTMRVSIPSGYLGTIPLHWFFNELKELSVAMKCLSRYGFDNRHQVVQLSGYGTEFAFAIERCECSPGSPMDKEHRAKYGERWMNRHSGDGVFKLYLWNERGSEAIFDGEFFGNFMKPLEPELVERANEAMIQASKGNLRCSDCGDLKSLSELPGTYFAGRYCEPCWLGTKGKNSGKGGWKAVEARETYD